MTMPTKRPKILVITDDETRQALEAMAEQESRSLSNMCDLIFKKAVEEWKSKNRKK